MRKFYLTEKYKECYDLLPKRETKNSAGYDLKSAENVIIEPGETKLIPLGVKIELEPNDVLMLFDRSSNFKKLGIVLINSVGIIDSDYFNNKYNEGLIMAQMKNITNDYVEIKYGDRIAQGLIMNFIKTDNDFESDVIRGGGFGSTTK